MKKTVDLSEEEIMLVEQFQERTGARNFSEAIRGLIKLSNYIAPKSAGEIKK